MRRRQRHAQRSAARRHYRDLNMWAAEALKDWHDFYVLVGTAAATLLALLFVAVSLGAGYLTEERQSATRTFMSPVIFESMGGHCWSNEAKLGNSLLNAVRSGPP